jgi:hypothetical protein
MKMNFIDEVPDTHHLLGETERWVSQIGRPQIGRPVWLLFGARRLPLL